MPPIPTSHLDLLADPTKALAYLATLMKDGSPQVTPLWFNFDGAHILINSAAGRVKDKNMRARPQVALCIADPQNPYRYLQIRGRVVEIITEGADEHINALSLKYRGAPWSYQPGQQRVIYKILPLHLDPH